MERKTSVILSQHEPYLYKWKFDCHPESPVQELTRMQGFGSKKSPKLWKTRRDESTLLGFSAGWLWQPTYTSLFYHCWNFHLVRLNIHLHELCWQTCFGWHFLTKVKLYKRSLMCGIKSFLSLYKTFKLCKERSDVSTPRTVNIWTYNKIITNFDVTLSTPCSAILTWHLTQPNGNITLRGKCSSLKRKEGRWSPK